MSTPVLFIVTAFLMLSLPIQAATPATAQTTQPQNTPQPLADAALHTALIETAIRYDFYNKRCRGVSFDKHYDKVNRLFVTKYRLTAHNYVKRHLNQDIKVLKQALEHQLNEQLNQLSSCQNAKDQGLVDDLQNQFNQLYQQAEKSPWFPE
ncbi:hypothetical protein [Thiomicrorhabdus aquaedulcis]|uniref:hypothetical protein n=1 Tax=Thiomicrorhabdus aquaedulcis TaxID=2211106 RepID=UPI000FD7C393|nr:hypothetical protein [Thiomicrorhabdus aquaedulcis]